MRILIVIILINLFSFQEEPAAITLTKSSKKKIDKAVMKVFDSANVEIIPIENDKKNIALFYLAGNEDVLGYLVLTSAKGRYDYFDFMVIYDETLMIKKIEVLTYRSDHGHEITSGKWLNQFTSTKGCDLNYGKDIQAISGATFSGNAITEGINKLCVSLNRLKEDGIIPPPSQFQ